MNKVVRLFELCSTYRSKCSQQKLFYILGCLSYSPSLGQYMA